MEELRKNAIDKLKPLAQIATMQLNDAIKNLQELNKIAQELGYAINKTDGTLIELKYFN